MSLNLAFAIMGLNSTNFDHMGRILDFPAHLQPKIASIEFLNTIQNSNSVDIQPAINRQDNLENTGINKTDEFIEKLHLRFKDETYNHFNLAKNITGPLLCNTAQTGGPKWKEEFTSPLRTCKSSVFHILGGNEKIYYAPEDDEGFGIPIPYWFTTFGNGNFGYTNCFGDYEPYNYSANQNLHIDLHRDGSITESVDFDQSSEQNSNEELNPSLQETDLEKNSSDSDNDTVSVHNSSTDTYKGESSDSERYCELKLIKSAHDYLSKSDRESNSEVSEEKSSHEIDEDFAENDENPLCAGIRSICNEISTQDENEDDKDIASDAFLKSIVNTVSRSKIDEKILENWPELEEQPENLSRML